jgi:hypothetical protein
MRERYSAGVAMSGGKPAGEWSDRALLILSVMACSLGGMFVAFAVRDRTDWKLAAAWVLAAALNFFFAWLEAKELWDRRRQRPNPSPSSPLPPGEG